MKRLFTALTILLLCTQVALARIASKVLGCNMGVTTQDEALATLRSQGFLFENESTQLMSTTPFFYKGREWNTLLVEFYEGKVMRISMFLFDAEKTTGKCLKNYETMVRKYRRCNKYLDPSTSDNHTRNFKDGHIELCIAHQNTDLAGSNSPAMASLTFTHLGLSMEQQRHEGVGL